MDYLRCNWKLASDTTSSWCGRVHLNQASCWAAHPRLAVVDNSTDFNGKMARSTKYVLDLVGVKEAASAPAGDDAKHSGDKAH